MYRKIAAALVASFFASAATADVPSQPGPAWPDRAGEAFAGETKPTFFITNDGQVFAASYLIGNAEMVVSVSPDAPQTVVYTKQ